MNISDSQKELLKEYGLVLPDNIDEIDEIEKINEVLLDLDDKITEIGFDSNYDLNEAGLKLQRLYDQLYNQN